MQAQQPYCRVGFIHGAVSLNARSILAHAGAVAKAGFAPIAAPRNNAIYTDHLSSKPPQSEPKQSKVFWFFFSKKNIFASFTTPPARS
jgi:hypothetical protein